MRARGLFGNFVQATFIHFCQIVRSAPCLVLFGQTPAHTVAPTSTRCSARQPIPDVDPTNFGEALKGYVVATGIRKSFALHSYH